MIEQFNAARKAKAPIVAIRTPDPASTIRRIRTVFDNGQNPIAEWDVVGGLRHVNELCRVHCANANKVKVEDILLDGDPSMITGNPVEALRRAVTFLPDNTIMFFHNGHMFVEQGSGDGHKPVIQSVWNLRDPFRRTGRTFTMLGHDIQVPAEIKHDVLVIDEPLPSDDELAAIVVQGLRGIGMTKPLPALLGKVVDAVAGLAAFNAEQVVLMAANPMTGDIDVENAWHNKIQIIEQDKSLKVFRGGNTFADIGGNENLKALLSNIVNGKRCPRLVVFIEEIDTLSSADTESSGTTMDQVKQLCVKMQDNGWDGLILYGFPGTAKSELAKAFGNEAGCATIQADLGGMKSKWVGSSEARFRSFIKIVEGMSNNSDRVFFIATCNKVANLRPEFKRRFRKGIAFSDLPDRAEKDQIWKLKLKRYELDPKMLKPDDTNWTGAEIDVCCANAAEFGISLIEASRFMTSVSQAMGKDVENIRQAASGKFMSAHRSGVYTYSSTKAFFANMMGGQT